MKRSLVVVVCLVLVVAAFAVEAMARQDDAPEVVEVPITWHEAGLTDGKELYVGLCAVCHGVTGIGDGPAAPALAKPVPDLTLLSQAADGVFPREGVEKAIRGQSQVAAHGTLEMPIWGHVFADARPDRKSGMRWALAEQRIQNLASYIETIQQ